MKNYNGESYMESYTDKEHEIYWGDELDEDENLDTDNFEEE